MFFQNHKPYFQSICTCTRKEGFDAPAPPNARKGGVGAPAPPNGRKGGFNAPAPPNTRKDGFDAPASKYEYCAIFVLYVGFPK